MAAQRIEKSVFISYRRTNFPWAMLVYQNLVEQGYDVFIDYLGIGSGDFESVILGNIRSRAHFLVLLSPSALERCGEPGDLLRREIETALASQRNVVPIMLEGFNFNTPAIADQLTGTLAALRNYNGITIPMDYFLAAMDRLHQQFLSVPLEAVLHPASQSADRAAADQKNAANAAPPVQEQELTAQEYFERAHTTKDPDEQIRLYTEAIRLKPDFSDAYNYLGVALESKGELDAALQSYHEGIRRNPNAGDAYVYRAMCLGNKGDNDAALQDYNTAIRLNPNLVPAYYNRGITLEEKGDFNGALEDYSAILRLDPNFQSGVVYDWRAALLERQGEFAKALADLQRYLEIGGPALGAYGDVVRQRMAHLSRLASAKR